MAVDDRHDVGARRLADRQGAEDAGRHRYAPFAIERLTESPKP
jgi:hypothetical protein